MHNPEAYCKAHNVHDCEACNGITEHPILGKVWYGYVIDETQIKPVPDGTKGLNETHGIMFPVPDPGPVKMTYPKKAANGGSGNYGGDDDAVIGTVDDPNCKAQFGKGIGPEWLNLPKMGTAEYLAMVRSGKAIEYPTFKHHYDDRMEQADVDAYRDAIRNRALDEVQGIRYHELTDEGRRIVDLRNDLIARHQSPEWRDPAFRAAFYEFQRKQK
jgi:hypothetical protein